MPHFKLTNHSDVFTSIAAAGWTDGSQVSGGNGEDTIRAVGDFTTLLGENGKDEILAIGDHNLINGGNGNDVLRVVGDGNWLLGGNGSDVLVANGEGNRLFGGNGPDQLVSVSFGQINAIGVGNILTGGQGPDAYVLNNRSDLRVVNDHVFGPPAAGEGVVSQGDVILGVMDVITDYAAGERLRINATQEVTGDVTLDDVAPLHRHLELGDGEYAFFHGNELGNGRFAVDAQGDDLLLVYDRAGGGDALSLQGAVILRDVTDPDAVFLV